MIKVFPRTISFTISASYFTFVTLSIFNCKVWPSVPTCEISMTIKSVHDTLTHSPAHGIEKTFNAIAVTVRFNHPTARKCPALFWT